MDGPSRHPPPQRGRQDRAVSPPSPAEAPTTAPHRPPPPAPQGRTVGPLGKPGRPRLAVGDGPRGLRRRSRRCRGVVSVLPHSSSSLSCPASGETRFRCKPAEVNGFRFSQSTRVRASRACVRARWQGQGTRAACRAWGTGPGRAAVGRSEPDPRGLEVGSRLLRPSGSFQKYKICNSRVVPTGCVESAAGRSPRDVRKCRNRRNFGVRP